MANDILKAEEKIKEMNEDEFQELLVKLFKTMGYENVQPNCGSQEYGKDIYFIQKDKISSTSYSVVVKAGNVNMDTAHTMIKQIYNSFDIPADTKDGKLKIQKVIAVTNGIYKQNSNHMISNSENLASKMVYITIWNITDVVRLCLEYIPTLVVSDQSIQLTEYKEKVNNLLSSYETLKFLQTDFGVTIDKIENLEIKCRAKYESLKKEKNQYLGDENKKQVPSMNLTEAEEVLKTHHNYLVTGIPTSGKSSFIKRLGRRFIIDFPENYVFYFELNKVYKSLTDGSIIDLLKQYYRELVDGEIEDELLKNSKSLLLLDALDEVPDDEIRAKILNKIKDFSTEYPKCQIVLTSRPIEFIINNSTIEELFERYELLPLNIEEFIKVGEKLLGADDGFGEYVKLVKKSDIINAFPKTPLTSILLCILFKEKQINVSELPANITELYKKFIDLFLNRWDTSKGISQQYKFQQKEFVLQSIAKYMQDNNLVYISEQKLKELLESLSKSKGLEDLKDITLFLTQLQKATNIFRASERDGEIEFSFFHLTIQEYLSSVKLKSSDEKFLYQNYYNDWWVNPSIFYVGKDPENAGLIKKIASLKNYPIETPAKIRYVVNSSMILTAGHLIDRSERERLLRAMIKIFNELVNDVIKSITFSENNPLRYKTILDLILDARNLFYTRFRINSFQEILKEIWENEIRVNYKDYNEILLYCLTYTLSLKAKKGDYLLEFVKLEGINVRWNKIVHVDITVNKLNHKKGNDQLMKKILRKSKENVKYINEQFKEPLRKHINSLLDPDLK